MPHRDVGRIAVYVVRTINCHEPGMRYGGRGRPPSREKRERSTMEGGCPQPPRAKDAPGMRPGGRGPAYVPGGLRLGMRPPSREKRERKHIGGRMSPAAACLHSTSSHPALTTGFRGVDLDKAILEVCWPAPCGRDSFGHRRASRRNGRDHGFVCPSNRLASCS